MTSSYQKKTCCYENIKNSTKSQSQSVTDAEKRRVHTGVLNLFITFILKSMVFPAI